MPASRAAARPRAQTPRVLAEVQRILAGQMAGAAQAVIGDADTHSMNPFCIDFNFNVTC